MTESKKTMQKVNTISNAVAIKSLAMANKQAKHKVKSVTRLVANTQNVQRNQQSNGNKF